MTSQASQASQDSQASGPEPCSSLVDSNIEYSLVVATNQDQLFEQENHSFEPSTSNSTRTSSNPQSNVKLFQNFYFLI